MTCGLLWFPDLTRLDIPTAWVYIAPGQTFRLLHRSTPSNKREEQPHPQLLSAPKKGILVKKKIIDLPCKTESPTMQILQFSVLLIFSILFTSTIGRPRIDTSSKSNSMSNSISNSLQMDGSSTKKPLSACEEAVASCCSSQWSTFQQTARCFELNNCPGINFIANPCFKLPEVINRI